MKLSVLAKLVKVVKTIRGIFVGLVILAIAIPVALYIILSSDWAQQKIRTIGAEELSALLGSRVEIGGVDFSPFNRLKISDVTVDDDFGATALTISELDTRFELWDLIFSKKIIIDYASVGGMELHLYRDSVGAPLNIAGIISHLSSDDKDKPPTVFNLRLNDVDIRSSKFTYDVSSVPATPGRFNPSHIAVDDISLMAFAPVVANDRYRVWLRKMSCTEQSGLVLSDLSAKCFISPDSITLSGLCMELPASLLEFSAISLPIAGIKGIPAAVASDSINLALTDDSHVTLADLKAFVPMFAELPYTFDIGLDATCSMADIDIHRLHVSDYDKIFSLDARGELHGLSHMDSLRIHDFTFDVAADSSAILSYLDAARPDKGLTPAAESILRALGNTRLSGSVSGSATAATVDLTAHTRLAKADVRGWIFRTGPTTTFDAEARIDSLLLGEMLANPALHSVSAEVKGKGTISHGRFSGDVAADISHFYFNGHRFADIMANLSISDGNLKGMIDIDDEALDLDAHAEYSSAHGQRALNADISVERASLSELGLSEKLDGYILSGALDVDAQGVSADCFRANINAEGLSVVAPGGKELAMKKMSVEADNLRPQGTVVVTSDYINGRIDGRLRFSSLAKEMKAIAGAILPALVGADSANPPAAAAEDANKFAFDFTISDSEYLCEFFGIPVSIIDSADIYGNVDGGEKNMFVALDAPWILQGNNVIERTAFGLDVNGRDGKAVLQLTSLIPTKKGDMDVTATVKGTGGHLDADIDWSLVRTIPINGNINFSTFFSRSPEDGLLTSVRFNPGKINFGNEIWEIAPSVISVNKNEVQVDNFALNAPSQHIVVNGVAGPHPDDILTVDLKDIELVNIFETLEIDKAMIGGRATGSVKGSALLSKEPVIACDLLKVKSIAYNYCTLGDADVKLSLDDAGKTFNFSAVVDGENSTVSYIDGFIIPATETLDLRIDADKVKVGFMKPFMEAFTSHIEGYASGDAHLYGTFKNIDLSGDIYASDLKIKIDFTNSWYTASDSIHIRPGMIRLDRVGLTDEYGNSAVLDGWVSHNYFHDASFHFDVRDARDFLCYDVNEKLSPDWYGRIFGNGTATIKGVPGVVDISANMTTAANTTFTFVLSDRLDANEYSFITFRDVTPHTTQPDSMMLVAKVPDKVKSVRSRKGSDEQVVPTAYNMDIGVDIRPQAEINIIMDPVGGDSIRSNGEGHMRMTYSSTDNDMRLYGTYTLEKGNYNFTLQDLIVKDLIIKEGSSIYFPGDPYRAKLNIYAYYPVQANLSDLDESFLQDKELNRTKVPVRALVNITGDMLQPDVSFDLEFPTLSQDIYRKVKSIISTEDMMNRQIIYLLAINRFYTPEYMASTTKGSELFSVVSSTISSRLSSMLGKLSDNWSIAPNLRSDRGDFSDLEVDLTLSSSLLNNRLLLNGNFGYRDKSLNTNQFVGDFDVEYLLTRSGDWRLKAYNRYNDQNYYLRTAQTTQGVGIQYRRDFDRTLRFLSRWLRKSKAVEPSPADSTARDSVPLIEVRPDGLMVVPDSISD